MNIVSFLKHISPRQLGLVIVAIIAIAIFSLKVAVQIHNARPLHQVSSEFQKALATADSDTLYELMPEREKEIFSRDKNKFAALIQWWKECTNGYVYQDKPLEQFEFKKDRRGTAEYVIRNQGGQQIVLAMNIVRGTNGPRCFLQPELIMSGLNAKYRDMGTSSDPSARVWQVLLAGIKKERARLESIGCSGFDAIRRFENWDQFEQHAQKIISSIDGNNSRK